MGSINKSDTQAQFERSSDARDDGLSFSGFLTAYQPRMTLKAALLASVFFVPGGVARAQIITNQTGSRSRLLE